MSHERVERPERDTSVQALSVVVFAKDVPAEVGFAVGAGVEVAGSTKDAGAATAAAVVVVVLAAMAAVARLLTFKL